MANVLGVAFVSDITERKKNEEALLDYQRQLQRLTASLLSVQETENRELARELHDVFSQELAALGMEVSTLLSSSEIASPLTQRLADLGKKIGHLADDMHRTSRQLHPAILHELGSGDSVAGGMQHFFRNNRTFRSNSCLKNMPASLPEDVSLCLYRVAQESLRNIRKHTGATGVSMHLRGEGEGVSLRVEDTGDGFRPRGGSQERRLGLDQYGRTGALGEWQICNSFFAGGRDHGGGVRTFG